MRNINKDLIFEIADRLAVDVYKMSKKLPREEKFGITSQIRRSAISVVLNIVEGYARQKRQDHRRFLEIAYGSVKETTYLLEFCIKIGYVGEEDVDNILTDYDEVARMLWSKIQTLKNS